MIKKYTSYPKRTSKASRDKQQDKEIKALTSRLKGLVEDKYSRLSVSATGVSNSSPYYACLNALTTGDDKASRSAVRVCGKNIEIRLNVYNSTNTFTTDNGFRVLIVREKPALGGNLSLNSLFYTSTPTHNDIFNHSNRDWDKRFTIVYDKTFNVWYNALAQYCITIKKKLNFITDYSRGNAGTYADIDTNSLWLVIVTEKTSATSTMSLKYEGEFHFQDA